MRGINNLSVRNKKCDSSVTEDLSIETNTMELKEFDNNMHCYRCKHFSNVPRNLSDTCENISDWTEECMADLNFVQAIVWLKSAIMSMRDISVEQFHLAFHKQWQNMLTTGDNFSSCSGSPISEVHETDLKSITQLSNIQKDGMNFRNSSSDYTDTSSIKILVDVSRKKNDYKSREEKPKENEILVEENNSPFNVTSYKTIERSFSVESFEQENITSKNRIILDSCGENSYSSESDMFRDSQESREVNDSVKIEENHNALENRNLIIERTSTEFLWTYQDSENLKETKDVASISSDDTNFSCITLFSKDRSSYKQYYDQLSRQLILESNKQTLARKACDSNSNSKDPIVPNQINATKFLQEDSAYDTYQLHAERNSMSNCTQQEEDVMFLSQKIDNITPYRKDEYLSDTCDLEMLSRDDTEFFDMLENNLYSGNIRQYLSSSQQKNYSSIQSQGCEHFTEDDEYTASEIKKRKLNFVHESTNEDEEKISSKWLKFTFDALNADEIVFQSVKMILSVLQNEKIAKQYMRIRCWKDTLEEQAIDAVLNFCDVFEATNKTNACTQEIVRVVKSLLNKSIKTTEMNKVTILTHQISIILQLCTSMQVCVEIINYLTEELKSYENILIAVTDDKMASVHNIHNQLHIMFFALTSCLQKYRLVFPNKETNLYEEKSIPPVVDLWKKRINCESEILKDNIKIREQRWLKIFVDFTAIAAKDFVQFAKKSRNLVNLLERK
ncbi:uncharacterized protein LOC143430494 [Xylocopa sonorina]|uniref:uncharacterized protein LOC143430494 n=1 Tax=Xylocopa sonorina TaxID=1818115 RepID=UPI00403AA39B